MRVTLEGINTKDKVSKEGKPYVSVGILVKGQWWNGFADPITASWRKGDAVEVELIDGQYKNFKPINPLIALEERVKALEQAVFAAASKTEPF